MDAQAIPMEARPAPSSRYGAALATPVGTRRWRRPLLPVLILLCPPLALALRGQWILALVAGGALAALRVWSVPELLPLSALVWGLLALLTLVLVGGD